MCVSVDLDVVVLACTNDTLAVHALSTGGLLRVLGGHGKEPGRFRFKSGGVCVTSRATVLVAEAWNRRVQEVTLADGRFCGMLGEGKLTDPDYVDCRNSDVVVSDGTRVTAFTWPGGVLRWHSRCPSTRLPREFFGIKLLRNGKQLAVVDATNAYVRRQ